MHYLLIGHRKWLHHLIFQAIFQFGNRGGKTAAERKLKDKGGKKKLKQAIKPSSPNKSPH